MMPSMPTTWRMVKLGTCLQRRKDTVMPPTLNDETVGLVGLEDIQDGGRGGISVRSTVPQEIGSLKTRFETGDILFGKLRPNLNKVGIAQQAGLCSTEIWAFGPSPLVNSQYAAFFLSFTVFVDRVASLTKGANLPRLDTEAFDSIDIPLPPLIEQEHIVEILQEAEAIRRLRAQAESKTAELIPAMFADFFGDLYSGKSAFPSRQLSTIGQLDRGKSKHRPRDDSSLYGGPYPFLQTGDVAKANGWVTSFSQTYSEKGLGQSRLWPAGTLLITIAANIGATAILTFDACFPDSIVGFTPIEGISAEYVRWWLLGYQRKLEIQAPQGAQKNINLEVLRAVRIPVPPLELQLKFKEAITNLREQQNASDAAASILSMLTSSLSANAFSGSLTADWRETRADALTTEARKRDAALKQAGAILTRSRRAATQDDEGIGAQRTDGIHADLNREQRTLLFHIHQNAGGGRHLRYFTADSLGRTLKGPLRRNPQAIEGHLAVFAVRGLVIPVSREEQTKDTGEFVFGNAYRLALRDLAGLLTDEAGNNLTTESGEPLDAEGFISDHARGRELDRLVAKIEKERGFS